MTQPTMMIRRACLAVVSALLMTAFLGACGPGPKSQELNDLERQLQDPSARDVKKAPGADKPYREARQYRRLSLEAWEDGKTEISKDYAILGMLRYRTAAAISEQMEAKARLEKANAKVGSANPEIKTLNDEQIKLSDEVADLQRQVAQARRRKEEEQRRQKALASQQNMQTQNADDAAKRQQLQNKISAADRAKSEADAVSASEYAPEKYNPADNLLKSIHAMSTTSVTDQMLADADKARSLFEEAKTAAQPQFQEAQEKQNPALRRQKLRSDAENIFGGPYVISEPAGARIVLASGFARGATTVPPALDGRLDEVVKLAKKYDEFQIHIEGYTSKGDATENLGISQLRAKAVEDYLTSHGIKGSRVDSKGLGQGQRRYPGEPDKNERVEVVFTR